MNQPRSWLVEALQALGFWLAVLFGLVCVFVLIGFMAHARAAESGQASYYHEGQRVACGGGRFDPEGMTAAHRTLPCGTRIRVTTRAGKSVIVTINDRGPARWTGRILDLARGPARQLGMIGPGHLHVTIEVLSR